MRANELVQTNIKTIFDWVLTQFWNKQIAFSPSFFDAITSFYELPRLLKTPVIIFSWGERGLEVWEDHMDFRLNWGGISRRLESEEEIDCQLTANDIIRIYK